MAVLGRRRLEEAHRRQVAGLESCEEVVGIVLMVCRVRIVRARNIAVPDRRDRARPRMCGVGGRGIVLERLMMRDVVERGERWRTRRRRIGLPVTPGGAI